jgi:Tfp pilus assembly protein PilX
MEKTMMRYALPQSQRGIVLPVALIMLIMLLLVAIVTYNMGRQNTIIAGNMQHKAEVVTSANQAVEEVISKTDFINNPAAALPGNKVQYDINGDGTEDITVTLKPAPCIKKAQAIKNSELTITNENDAACVTGATQNLGIEGATTGNSLCANTVWEVTAVAVDNVTGAEAEVTTGVGVRVSVDDAKNPANICPG